MQVSPESIPVSPSKTGIVIPKKILIIVVAALVLSFVAIIIGLSVGLKDAYKTECNDPSEIQKYEACVDLSCRNQTLLQSIG